MPDELQLIGIFIGAVLIIAGIARALIGPAKIQYPTDTHCREGDLHRWSAWYPMHAPVQHRVCNDCGAEQERGG